VRPAGLVVLDEAVTIVVDPVPADLGDAGSAGRVRVVAVVAGRGSIGGRVTPERRGPRGAVPVGVGVPRALGRRIDARIGVVRDTVAVLVGVRRVAALGGPWVDRAGGVVAVRRDLSL
jgi:hypothetical protein